MDRNLKPLIEELTEDQDLYINLKDLVEHFVAVDAQCNDDSWDLLQILSELRIIPSKRIGGNTVKELLENDKPGCDLSKFYKSRGYQLKEFCRP